MNYDQEYLDYIYDSKNDYDDITLERNPSYFQETFNNCFDKDKFMENFMKIDHNVNYESMYTANNK
jgi:hypothetical protein